MSVESLLSEFYSLLQAGGYVMPPLAACTALLWYALGYRYWVLQERKSGGIRDLLLHYKKDPGAPAKHIVEQAVQYGLIIQQTGVVPLQRHLDEAFFPLQQEIRRFSTSVKAVIVIAPLLGLLGTVAGMIETFDSLADMALFTQSGGIAGGISQALITTQMGLAVAIPGVLLHSVLLRRQRQIEREIAQLKSLLCSMPGHGMESTS